MLWLRATPAALSAELLICEPVESRCIEVETAELLFPSVSSALSVDMFVPTVSVISHYQLGSTYIQETLLESVER